MNKVVIAFVVSLLPFVCSGQTTNIEQLTLGQVVKLYNKDFSDINDYLVERNWEFNEVRTSPDNNSKSAIWHIIKDGWTVSSFGVSYDSNNSDAYFRGIYICNEAEIFNNLKEEAISLKMEKVKSGIINNEIYSDYVGDKYAIRLGVRKGSGVLYSMFYTLYLYNRDYYYKHRYDD